MRVLFDNLVIASTLTTDEPNGDYPVTNLAHPFLRRKYQSVAATATITVTFKDDATVDCLFYGWHNLTSIVMRLYDSGDVLKDTVTVSSPESGVGSKYFTAVPSIAGLGIGEHYELPRPLADFEEGLDNRGAVVASRAGQAQHLYVEPLKVRAYTVAGMDRDTRSEIAALMKDAGVGRPLWLDAFHLNHNYEPPMYCRLTRPWSTAKSGVWFDAQDVEFEEMR
jgi:hypothetical protein